MKNIKATEEDWEQFTIWRIKKRLTQRDAFHKIMEMLTRSEFALQKDEK